MVLQHIAETTGIEHLHLLVDVEVEQTCRTIAEHVLNDGQRITLQRGTWLKTPAQPQALGLGTNHGGVLRCRQIRQGGKLRLSDILARLPCTKILVDDGNNLVGVKVARHTDGDIIRTIPLVKVVLDVDNGRILQVFL